jgi:hypothetical protein
MSTVETTTVELPGVSHPGTDAPSEPKLCELGPDFTVWIGAERDARLIYKEIYEDRLYDVEQLPPKPCKLRNLDVKETTRKCARPEARR